MSDSIAKLAGATTLQGTLPTSAKIMIYGTPGSGKTSLTATLAHAGYKIVLLDVDRGGLALRKYVLGKDKLKIGYRAIQTHDELEKTIDAILAGQGNKPELYSDQVLVIDTISIALRNCHEDAEIKTKGLKAWGVTSTFGTRLVGKIARLHCNVILYAWQKIVRTKEGDIIRIKSDLMPSVESYIDGSMPYIFNLSVQAGGRRELITGQIGPIEAKDRSGILQKREPADLGAILRQLQSSDNIGQDLPPEDESPLPESPFENPQKDYLKAIEIAIKNQDKAFLTECLADDSLDVVRKELIIAQLDEWEGMVS